MSLTGEGLRIISVLLVLVMTGCNQDRDGDGFSEDCDDDDAAVHTGAAEVCDGKDNNCDEQIDEGWFTDADGDGFGDSDTPASCGDEGPWVQDRSDCDDADAERWPGHAEVCDGIDNDCDGGADDGLPIETWYEDVDADGFGNPLAPASLCEASAGYALDNTDCDDENALTWPGAIEQCDEDDNDCDGSIDEEPDLSVFLATVNYEDRDGDGKGNPDVSLITCGPIGDANGWVLNDFDCDDNDPSVPGGTFEGVTECDDGKDNECDGATDADDPDCQ